MFLILKGEYFVRFLCWELVKNLSLFFSSYTFHLFYRCGIIHAGYLLLLAWCWRNQLFYSHFGYFDFKIKITKNVMRIIHKKWILWILNCYLHFYLATKFYNLQIFCFMMKCRIELILRRKDVLFKARLTFFHEHPAPAKSKNVCKFLRHSPKWKSKSRVQIRDPNSCIVPVINDCRVA